MGCLVLWPLVKCSKWEAPTEEDFADEKKVQVDCCSEGYISVRWFFPVSIAVTPES